jgi:hypothetical protein
MPTQDDLVAYVREAVRQGAARLQISEQLQAHGWTTLQINAAFAVVNTPVTPTLMANTPSAPAATVTPMQTPAQAAVVQVPAPVEAPVVAPASQPAPMQGAPVVQPTPSAWSPPASVAPTATVTPPPRKKGTGFLVPLIVVIVVVALFGGTAYAYMNKIGPFARLPYTEENLFSGLLARAANIKTSTYSFKGSLAVEEREKGAVPFTIQIPNEDELRQQYQDDYTRGQNAGGILTGLAQLTPPYPATLTQVISVLKARGSYYASMTTTDPSTKKPYLYKTTKGGQDFELTIEFEIPENVSSLSRRSSLADGTTMIDGTSVTFTSGSPSFFFLSKEPKKPFLAQLGDFMQYLPEEMRFAVGITAASSLEVEKAEWKFNANAEGDFGDLTYKVDIDALRKDGVYYFRINNLPSLFLGEFAGMKGEWVAVDPSLASSTPGDRYNSFTNIADQIARSEEQYKATQEDWNAFMKKVITFADEEKLIQFKETPRSEKVDGRLLYRYELTARKEAIIPFMKKVVEEAKAHAQVKNVDVVDDPGLITYLESEEFSKTFDYLQENVSVTLHVDPLGYPARIEYSVRVVPPDTAIQLQDKQVRIIWSGEFSDINKPVNVEAPTDAKPFTEYMEQVGGGERSIPQEPKIKAELAALATSAELAYDTNNGAYGVGIFKTGACKKTPGTLFGVDNISQILDKATDGNMARATCSSTSSAYAVSVPLPDTEGYGYCVDSTGFRGQIRGAITTTKCQ